MLTLSKLFWLLLLGAGAAYWWVAREIKETAYQAAKAYCQRMDVAFLDESVVLRKLRPVRGEDGRLGFLRRYSFEFTTTGAQRYGGVIVLQGRRVKLIQLDAHHCPE